MWDFPVGEPISDFAVNPDRADAGIGFKWKQKLRARGHNLPLDRTCWVVQRELRIRRHGKLWLRIFAVESGLPGGSRKMLIEAPLDTEQRFPRAKIESRLCS